MSFDVNGSFDVNRDRGEIVVVLTQPFAWASEHVRHHLERLVASRDGGAAGAPRRPREPRQGRRLRRE